MWLRTMLSTSLVILSSMPCTATPYSTPAGSTYYISTSGSDNNNGSYSKPWRTLAHAVELVPDNNSTIIVRDGVYNECVTISRRFTTSLLITAENQYRVRWQCNQPERVIKFYGANNITLEGFEITRPDLSADHRWVMVIRRASDYEVVNITLRNNIFHDSTDDDLLQVGNGIEGVTITGNMFYNQAGIAGEHIDVNGAVDTIIQDNIFFNDFAGSGRVNPQDTNHYIVIKDSVGTSDGIVGARNTTVRRNIFLNWEGRQRSFIMVGEDGISTFEAVGVTIENNLLLGNSPSPMHSAISIRGSKNVTVRANTIVGDRPGWYYVVASYITGDNPKNENIRIHNNIWSDPTGTMGDWFTCCSPSQTTSFTFDNNLFFNAGNSFPSSYEPFVTIEQDAHRVIGDPKLGDQSGGITVPRWNGNGFNGGYNTIREAFEGLVEQYGTLGPGSAAIDRADPNNMPADDILGNDRSVIHTTPDIGAYEAYGFTITTDPVFRHISPGESTNYILSIETDAIAEPVSISFGDAPQGATLGIDPAAVVPPGTAMFTLTSTHASLTLRPDVFANIPITATSGNFTRITSCKILIGGMRVFLPMLLKVTQ